MRIYSDCRELMSEMGRDLWEMGHIVKPKTYQNKVIEGNEDFETKEIISEQYCLTSLDNWEYLFAYTESEVWADLEYQERVSGKEINPGHAYELRSEMWEQFLVDGKFDYSYPERFNQVVNYKGEDVTLLKAIALQLSTDPDTRKAILPVFGSYVRINDITTINYERDIDRLDGSKRIPCSMYYDFLLREGRLNILYHQRSSDFIDHFGNDVYLAWRLMEYMVHLVNQQLSSWSKPIKTGYLYHTIDSLHAYKKDWVKLKSNVDDYIN